MSCRWYGTACWIRLALARRSWWWLTRPPPPNGSKATSQLARSSTPETCSKSLSLTQRPERAPDRYGGHCCPQARRCSRVACAAAAASVACHGKASRDGARRRGLCTTMSQGLASLASTSYRAARDRKATDERLREALEASVSAQQGRCNGFGSVRDDDLAGPGNPVRGLGPSADVTSPPPPVRSTARARRRLPSPSRWPAPLTCRAVAVRLRPRAHAPAAIVASGILVSFRSPQETDKGSCFLMHLIISFLL